jgi:hypothetical protein
MTINTDGAFGCHSSVIYTKRLILERNYRNVITVGMTSSSCFEICERIHTGKKLCKHCGKAFLSLTQVWNMEIFIVS